MQPGTEPTPATNIQPEPAPTEDPLSVESSTLELVPPSEFIVESDDQPALVLVPAAMSVPEGVLVELDILELIPRLNWSLQSKLM